MRSHGLRGSFLESIINITIDNYRKKKLALIQKIPTPITPTKQDCKGHITKGYFAKKSTVDFIGVVQEIPVCFDAKECDDEKFGLKNVHEHQIKFMTEWEEQGGVAFLLIFFKKKDAVYYMRNRELLKYINLKKRSVSYDQLDTNFLLSIKGKSMCDFLTLMQNDLDER